MFFFFLSNTNDTILVLKMRCCLDVGLDRSRWRCPTSCCTGLCLGLSVLTSTLLPLQPYVTSPTCLPGSLVSSIHMSPEVVCCLPHESWLDLCHCQPSPASEELDSHLRTLDTTEWS